MRGEEEEEEVVDDGGGDYVVVHPFPMFALGQQQQQQQQQLGKAEPHRLLNSAHNVSLEAADCTVEVFLGKGEACIQGCGSGSGSTKSLNPDPIRIRIHNHACIISTEYTGMVCNCKLLWRCWNL
jgi:hypothetical protein